MRVVIDTNVLVSAVLSPHSVPGRILELLRQERFELLISDEIFVEYSVALQYDRVRKRHRLSDELLNKMLQDLRAVSVLVIPSVAPNVVSDPDDNKLFACALSGGAHFIVSGDIAVQTVNQYQGIRVLSPRIFLAMIEQAE